MGAYTYTNTSDGDMQCSKCPAQRQGPVDCQLSKPRGEHEECQDENVRKCKYKRRMRWKRKGIRLLVRVGDADLLTNAQSVAIQAGINVQHPIKIAPVGFGNLPTCIAGLDVIVGTAFRTSFCRRLRVNGASQPED